MPYLKVQHPILSADLFTVMVLVCVQILKQNNTRLENRTQLVTMCHMGPKVFINCAGFIKIDTASLGDRLVPLCPSTLSDHSDVPKVRI